MKINKAKLFKGKDGAVYLDFILIETPNGKYGNDFMVVEALSQQEAQAGKTQGTILGNAKHFGKSKPSQNSQSSFDQSMDDIPL